MSDKKFENQMEKLESIVKNIESGKLSLEDSLKEFYKGLKLSKSLVKRLDEIDQKIEMVLKDDGNEIDTSDFLKD